MLVRYGAAIAFAAICSASACGGDESTAQGSPGSAASTGAGGGGGTSLAVCALACSAPADCVQPNANPPFDGDNWACDSGSCRWLGCLDDSECDFFGGVCRLGFVSFTDVKTCTEACTDVTKCAEVGQSIDVDNWSCEDGGCKYIGCLSDDECVSDFGGGSTCRAGERGPPMCTRPCASASDCVLNGAGAAHDADNYTCRDGVCVDLGCKSDDECKGELGGSALCGGS